MKNVPNKCRENQNTLFVCINFFLKIVLVYEIIWKNILECGRTQLTIWGMRIVCWIPEATNTHSNYVILIAFLIEQWLHERA
jgi:hypothetical protein